MSNKQYRVNGTILRQYAFNILSLAGDGQWHEFNNYRKDTLKKLLAEDLLTVSLASHGLSTQYRITGRGKTFLATVASRTPKRTDGRCPRCDGANERHVNGQGVKQRYCRECWKSVRAKSAHRIRKFLCAQCKQNPRERRSSGAWDSYCHKCRLVVNKERTREWHLQKVAEARNGKVFLCPKCGVNPCMISKSRITYTCRECKRVSDSARWLRLKHEAFERRIKS